MTRSNRYILPAVLGIATAIAGAVAIAQSPASPPPVEKPRTIDVAKMQERAKSVFTATDTNGDAVISRDEFAKHEPRRMGRKHRRHHAPADAPETNAALFQALDSDGNGQLSSVEFEQLRTKARELRKNAAFDRMDANADGVLDADEFPPFARRAAELDSDGDGKVTRDEIRAARAAKNPPKAP